MSQLSIYKANSLSQAGRTVLIQANLATKSNYQMQSFSLPTSIHPSLDRCYRSFFRNKNLDSKSLNLIGWDKVCLSKKFRGLGIRKAKTDNMALQPKLLWKIVNSPENLWIKLVKKEYLKNDDWFSYVTKEKCVLSSGEFYGSSY